MYREYKPNILLTPYIETYWATDENVLDSQTLRILPDGSVNVLFNLAENEDCVIKPFIPYIIGAKVEIKSGNEKYGAIELNDKGFRVFEVERRSHLKPR